MSATDRSLTDMEEQKLHAYHDGQLGPIANWWWRGRIARSPALQGQLEQLEELGNWVREAESEKSADLWDHIALRLPAADAERAETAADPSGRTAEPLGETFGWMARMTRFRPMMAAATAAVAIAAVLVTIGDGTGQRPGAVRWLDTGGRSVIIVDNPETATIVWLLDSPADGV